MTDTKEKRDAVFDLIAPLRNGIPVLDDDFDLVYSPSVRKLSTSHWTPVRVACRAAALLTTTPGTRVLDIGSGAGKFCIIGAMTTSSSFVGIEQRKHLIEEAAEVCQTFEISRVEFVHGNMADLDWTAFNAFYLFNPFFENVASFALIDESDTSGFERYQAYVAIVRRKLRALPVGVKVATYHGFGGKVPDCYDLSTSEQIGSDRLNIWIKNRETTPLTEIELAEADLNDC